MKKIGKVLEIVVYIMAAQLTVCAILDVLHVTDFVQYAWFLYEGLLFAILIILTVIISSPKS